jgi:outer membrane protein insertion porin family
MDELSEDVETIRNLYFNKGYIQVQVDEPVIEKDLPPTTSTYDLLGTPNTVTIDHSNELVVHINIKEGDQFRIASVTFKGNTTLSDHELEKEVKLKHGDVFSRDGLRQDVGRIMDRYDGIARPFAGVVPQFNINPDTKSVDIAIEIQEGGEVRIGRIESREHKTRDKVSVGRCASMKGTCTARKHSNAATSGSTISVFLKRLISFPNAASAAKS